MVILYMRSYYVAYCYILIWHIYYMYFLPFSPLLYLTVVCIFVDIRLPSVCLCGGLIIPWSRAWKWRTIPLFIICLHCTPFLGSMYHYVWETVMPSSHTVTDITFYCVCDILHFAPCFLWPSKQVCAFVHRYYLFSPHPLLFTAAYFCLVPSYLGNI